MRLVHDRPDDLADDRDFIEDWTNMAIGVR